MSSSPSPTTVLAEAQWSQQATASSPSRQRPSPLDNTNSQSASSGLHTAYSNITVQTTSATEEAAEFDPWIRKTLLTFGSLCLPPIVYRVLNYHFEQTEAVLEDTRAC